MRNTFPSRDELSAMSLSRLRNLDIQEADEEALVQEIVTAKLRTLPPEGAIYRGDVPDIESPEEEAQWQKKIDERTAEKKAKVVVEEAIKVPEAPTEVKPSEVLSDTTPVDVPKAFSCKICHGKKAHKRGCPSK